MRQEEQSAPQEAYQAAPEGEKEKNVGMAVVAYILFFIPLLTDAKEDPFVKFHVKQGLLVFIGAVLAQVLNFTIILMPLGMLALLGVIILAVLGIINAVNGEQKELPLIGQYASKFNF